MRTETTTLTRTLPAIQTSVSPRTILLTNFTNKHNSNNRAGEAEEVQARPGLRLIEGSPQKVGGAVEVSTTTSLMSDWTRRSFLDLARRRGRPGAITTPGAAVKGEGSRSTGSPGHTEKVLKLEKMVGKEEELESRGEIGVKGWREVEKEENKRELATAARGSQEEVDTAIKMAKGGECVSIDESRSFHSNVLYLFILIFLSCLTSQFFLTLSRECSVPNLSTTRPIQKSLSRQNSQYSEDMDNLMNTKLVSGSSPPNEGRNNPLANHAVVPGFGSALHLAKSGTHGSLVTLGSYGNIGHQRAHSVIRLPHPDYTALDMPIFPSINAILQGKTKNQSVLYFLYHLPLFK